MAEFRKVNPSIQGTDDIILDAVTNFARHKNLATLLNSIADYATKLLQVSGCTIYLYNEEHKELKVAISKGFPELIGVRLNLGEGVAGKIAQTQKAMIVKDHRKFTVLSPKHPESKVKALAGLPITFEGKLLGVLAIFDFDSESNSNIRKYNQEDINLLTTYAELAGLAIGNMRAFEGVQLRNAHIAALNKVISASARAGTDIDQILDSSLEKSLRAINADTGAIWLSWSSRGVQRMVNKNIPENIIYLMANAPVTAGNPKVQTIKVDDWNSTKRKNSDQFVSWGIRSTLIVPLISKEKCIGGMIIASQNVHEWTLDEVDLVEAIGREVGSSAARAKLFEETTIRLDELEAVNRVSKSLRLTQSLEEMLPVLMDETLVILGVEAGGIWLHNAENGKLCQVIGRGWCRQLETIDLESDESLPGKVFSTGDIYFSHDVAQDPFTSEKMRVMVPQECNAIFLPIHSEQKPIGVLVASAKLPREFTPENAHLLVTLSEITGNAIYRTRLNEQMIKHAADLELRVAERTAELQAALQKAQAADRLKSEFIININHELRTPLTNLVLYYQMLRSQPTTKSEERLDVIGRELQRLRVLIEELLNLTRFDLGQVKPRFVQRDFNVLVQSLVNDRRPLVEERGLELSADLQPDLNMVWLDESTISQAVSNLLTNAMNYTPRGGKVKVTTISEIINNEPWVAFRIQDTGNGIDVGDMPHLFERFYRGKTGHVSGAPGTGLGLAIVKQVVDYHHGRIDVENGNKGTGAVFTMRLPVKQPKETV